MYPVRSVCDKETKAFKHIADESSATENRTAGENTMRSLVAEDEEKKELKALGMIQ
jgi:hypothetical protein